VFKRLRWIVIGYVGGVASSWWALRRVRRTVERIAPPQVRDRAVDGLRDARADVRAAVAEGRAAMREREEQLRSTWERRPERATGS
jgi:hypothetical protein